MRIRGWAIALIVLLMTGCASADKVQRAREGPRADEVWTARFVRDYGRTPTFDERTTWREELDLRVTAYLRTHPDIGTSPRASQFRFQRRVQVGMTVEEVLLLLDEPESRTGDQSAMQAAAGTFWPVVQAHARELWFYSADWRLYFADGRLVDITVGSRPPLD